MTDARGDIDRRRAAMAQYCDGFRAGNTVTIDSGFIRHVAGERERIRAEEGGGGYCHYVTEILEVENGWTRLPVSYLDLAGEVICAGHYVSVLPDGSLLDPTRDQFGEGHDVSLIQADSDDYARYRPEFMSDWHPGHVDDVDGLLKDWLPDFSGIDDFDAQDALRQTRGEGWWLDDKTFLIAYLNRQMEYGGDGSMSARLKALGVEPAADAGASPGP